MRNLADLLSNDPAWPILCQWISEAKNKVEVLPATDPDRSDALLQLQVTTRSPMGAVVYETGGILVDSGWIRLLGSGHPRLPRTLPDWNLGRTCQDDGCAPSILIVADDVVGGTFAINGGDFNGAPGQVYYFAPDSLAWESLDFGYSDFLNWVFNGDLAQFYQGQRWPQWQDEVRALPGDRGFYFYPNLWAKGPPLEQRVRSAVPMAELYGLQLDFQRQMAKEVPAAE
ncbi:MAG: hypothetical protein RL748_1206 [Pseudomonadota bacterium]